MNSTPAEFTRAMRLAFGQALSEAPSGLLLSTPDSTLHFALTSETPRKIGALHIASLRVEISVQRGDEAAAQKLLAQVDHATLRGGG